MKSFNKRLLGGLLAIFMILLFEGGISYFGNHSYYGSMITFKNLGLILSAIGASVIPIYYLYQQKKPQFGSLLWRIALSLGIFSLLHEIISGTLISLFAGILLLWNNALLLILGSAILFGIFLFGSWIIRTLKIFSETKRTETLLSFGVGLVTFLVLMQILMGFGIFTRWILWIIIIGFLALFITEKKHLTKHLNNINEILGTLHQALQGKYRWIWITTISASLIYFFFGFNHSIIPYPTAWDANHEYIYTPKIIAENAGILRGNNGTASGMPYLRHSFIAFAFSFRTPISHITSLSADSFAINMNFRSGIFVLLFGLATIREGLKIFNSSTEKNSEINQSAFLFAWGLLLLWLTSGMGAFLLFVDNKTDMGVLSLTTIALFAGMNFINQKLNKQGNITNKSTIYLIISALFFGFAVMAKPTAFIDVVIFGLLMIGLRLNGTSAIGIGLMTLGTMGIIQPLYASAFLSPGLGRIIIGIGLVVFIIGGIRGILNRKTQFINRLKNIIIWGFIFLFTIIIFKGPWLAYQKIVNHETNRSSFPKTLILGYQQTDKKEQKAGLKHSLLATSTTPEIISQQDQTDTEILNTTENNLSLAQCKTRDFSDSELSKNLQKAPGSTLREDFGRYIGFNGRTFKRSGIAGLLLKIAFWKNNSCYGANDNAVLLCKNKELLATPSIQNLEKLQEIFKSKKGKINELIESGFNLSGTTTLETIFSDLETYYLEHSIQTSNEGTTIPYRYLVPINAVFNRALQNTSSYYTDIGIVWIFIFTFLIAGLLYALAKLNKKLILIISSVGIGWIIRWAIAAGIVRYGLGLMIWLIIAVASFWQIISDEEKKSKERINRVFAFLAFVMIIQLLINFFRISSQAGSGPFGWYKASAGKEQKIGSSFLDISDNATNYKYGANEVFALQFGQYSPLINALKDRKDKDGVLIAGTYIQYFLNNQKNIKLDGLLSRLREQMSDYNSCKTYHRLGNQNIKYLVIDPNIGTVGRVGAGNESLFHRFFAKLDTSEKNIQTHGAMTMLAKFAQDGYLKLFFTNNIGAKYAFTLTNDELESEFGAVSEEELILIRAKLAVAKFFITQQDLSLLEHINTIFNSRLSKQEGLDDFANILNKKIDAKKLYTWIQNYVNGSERDLNSLSNDEKLIAAQYISLMKMMQAGQAQTTLNSIIQESIFGNSQLIALELL